jgi:hypothetical protein
MDGKGDPKCTHRGAFHPVGMTTAFNPAANQQLLTTQILCKDCGQLFTVITDVQLPSPKQPNTVVKPVVPGIGGKN